MRPGQTHVDIAKCVDAGEAAVTMSELLRAVLRQVGGEVTLPADWDADGGEIVLVDPLPDGRQLVRVAARIREDDRVPAGGWIHVLSGQAVRVDGVSHEGLVVVHHLTGEPGHHRADQTVEDFLRGHVPADAVPFIGGSS